MYRWITAPVEYKRKRTSVYLRADLAEGVSRLADKRKLSFSEALNRITERGLGMDSLRYA